MLAAVAASFPRLRGIDGKERADMASIDAIEGIGHKHATKLRKHRVRTTEALLKRGATRKGRRDLANETGLSEKLILEWVNRADLMRVKGIGEEYSDLLEAAGVDTVKELRRRNAANLLNAMISVNTKKRLVRRLPTEGMVERWVDHAKTLEAVVRY
jgi:predicted flap endonuclease-1-like 5' DNA nuclease